MDTDRFQPYSYGGSYGSDTAVDPSPRPEYSYGYDDPNDQYHGNGYGYASGPPGGEYGDHVPGDDHHLYGQGANAAASAGASGGGYAEYGGYPSSSGYASTGGYASAGGYGVAGSAAPYGYAQPDSGYAQPNTGYAQPNREYQQPNSRYGEPNSRYAGPNSGYAGPNTGYPGENTYTPDPVTGSYLAAGYRTVTGYAETPPGGYPTGQQPRATEYAGPAPTAYAGSTSYPTATPVQYPFQAPAAPVPTRRPEEPPADWFRPDSVPRDRDATSVLPAADVIDGRADAEPEEDTGVHTVSGAPAATSTALARITDVVPAVETPPEKRRQAARSEGRASIPESLQRRIIIALVLGFGAVTMWIWWLGAYPGSIDSYHNLVGSVGQVAGLMGEYLLLVQVLLMARVPWLERAVGTEHLTRTHVILGFSVMGLITEHILCATYLNTPPGVSPVTGVVGVLLGLRDVLAAGVGTALMFGVVFLSTRRMRRRIPYEVWRYLHLFVYIGIMLEFIHQMTLGVHFLNSRVALGYWIVIHAVTVYCVAWYRFGVVIRMNIRHQLRVDSVVEEGPGVYSIYFAGKRLEKFSGTAGQFCRWRFMNREGWWQSHPFSLSAAPTSKYLRITVKQLGDWTRMHLPDLEPGTRVIFSGPYGGLTPERRKRRKVLLVAAGIGITPMRSLLAGLPADPGDITLIYRASKQKDLVFREELDELARQRGATVHYLIGPRDMFKGGDPLGAAQLKELVPALHRHDVYLCGPDGMLAAAIKGLRGAKVPRRQIHTERFAF